MRAIAFGTVIPVIAAVALWGAAAQGDVTGDDVGRETGIQEPVKIAQGLMCDSQRQAEHYVELVDRGTSVENALKTVNRAAGNPAACVPATVGFTGGKLLTEKTVQGMSAGIVEITVVAAVDGEHWAPVDNQVQYTVILQDGVNV